MRVPISVAIVLMCTGITHAESCNGEIARAERVLRQAHPDIWLPESTAAKLHHQTTRASLEKARTEAKDDLEDSIAIARQLNAEGKHSECVTTIEKFLRPGVPAPVFRIALSERHHHKEDGHIKRIRWWYFLTQ